jgi:hypothetical protein
MIASELRDSSTVPLGSPGATGKRPKADDFVVDKALMFFVVLILRPPYAIFRSGPAGATFGQGVAQT